MLRCLAVRRSPLFALATVGGLGAACGPAQYISEVGNRAATAVADARAVHAMDFAPYEMTCAEQYLKQAREEGAYAYYQTSVEFARKAQEKAQQARAIARERQSPLRSPATPGPGTQPAIVAPDPPAPRPPTPTP